MNELNRKKYVKAISDFKVCNQEIVSTYSNGYLGKKVYKVVLNDGTSRLCEQITKNNCNGDAVVIIPITINGDYVVVVQSRPNTEETVSIEFPAGMVDENECFLEAARRELLEETGYIADNLYLLEEHYQDQGCSKAIIKTFVAEECKRVNNMKLDRDEKLAYVEMSYEDILDLVKNEKKTRPGFKDANSKIAFMQYTLKKKGIM